MKTFFFLDTFIPCMKQSRYLLGSFFLLPALQMLGCVFKWTERDFYRILFFFLALIIWMLSKGWLFGKYILMMNIKVMLNVDINSFKTKKCSLNKVHEEFAELNFWFKCFLRVSFWRDLRNRAQPSCFLDCNLRPVHFMCAHKFFYRWL